MEPNDDTKSRRTRVTDAECDECESSEGSMVRDRENDWTLCIGCMNDPEVLAEHAE